METLTKFDNPGDCQTSTKILTKPANENKPTTQIANNKDLTTKAVNTNAATTANATTTTIIVKHATSPTTPTATSKSKSQQQQQQQQHQFRAPQQFVKHKKTSASTANNCNSSAASTSLNNNKKNKFGNKRQNRSTKQNLTAGGVTTTNTTTLQTPLTTNLDVDDSKTTSLSTTSSKADLENIQNLKNQQHYQNNHHGGVGSTTSSQSESRIAGQCGFPSLLTMTSDKLGYGHGHLKQQQQQQQQQQLHKRPLPPHRGGGGNGGHNNHHHHVLCAGTTHNTLVAGGPGAAGNGALVSGGVPNSSLTCCHINGCSSHTTKDSNSSNNSITNASSTIHVCCLRSKFFLPDKRPRKGNFIPPTKFLLGGNISDPLNLSSLQNEASSACSNNTTPATTPRQSPITTPPKVEVIIPPNIHDPLHLLDPVDSMEYEKQLTSPMKRGISLQASLALGLRPGGGGQQAKSHKHRHRKNRKPKRHRYNSFNSTTSTLTDSLDEPNMSSALSSSSFATEKSSSSLLSISLDLATKSQNQQQQEPHSAGSSCGDGGDDDELSEHNLHSPQELLSLAYTSTTSSTITTSVTTSVTTSATATANATKDCLSNIVATNLLPPSPLSVTPTENQEIVSLESTNVALKDDAAVNVGGVGTVGTVVGGVLNAAAEIVLATRERACRDLRLDLISTTTGSGSTTTSCASSIVSGGGNGGGRKRKISESNNSQKNKKYFRVDSMDKIVSPVVPQPGAWKRPPRTTATGARKSQSRRSTSISETTVTDLSPVEETSKMLVEDILPLETADLVKVEPKTETIKASSSPLKLEPEATANITPGDEKPPLGELTTKNVDTKNALILAENVKKEIITAKMSPKLPHPKFSVDGKKYRYGNYDRYAGLRHLNEVMDIRLQVFMQYPELFKNKDILDIGCNVGQMTISVARKLAPKSILGIDIDMDLIARARRNLAMYVRIPVEMVKNEVLEKEDVEAKDLVNEVKQKKGRRRRKKKRLVGHKLQQHHQQQHHHNQLQTQAQQQPHHHGSYAHWQHFHQHVLHYHLLHHHHHHHHHHHLYLQQESSTVDTSNFFPISFPLSYGGITANTSNTKATSPQNIESQSPASTSTTTRSTPGHPATSIASYKASNTAHSTTSNTTHKPHLMKTKNDFPHNVYFRQTNYVLKDETMLANDTQQYDLILCLSVTKWIHLNFGDAGLKSAFKRMFNQLRPGGKLILEAQNWASYKKKKNLTEDIYNNYHNIEFYPNKFHEYLLSSEVGFSHSYTLGIPKHLSKGFSRPIQLYAKGDFTPNHVRWSDAYYPQTPFEAYRGIYATMPTKHGMHSAYPLISSSRSQTYDTPHYMGGGGASGPYSCRQTPMHQPSTSQYYNPLESDSYQPSYDMEYLNHMYVFASPLYQTVWSPPTSMRKSSSHTPVFGSVRDAEFEGDGNVMTGGSYHKHVYPPNDDTSSPNANAMNAFNSIRDPDTDDSNQQKPHVYATNCGESSTSPQTNLNTTDTETLEGLMMDDDRSDLSEA